jgi:hypothetical protein
MEEAGQRPTSGLIGLADLQKFRADVSNGQKRSFDEPLC